MEQELYGEESPSPQDRVESCLLQINTCGSDDSFEVLLFGA